MPEHADKAEPGAKQQRESGQTATREGGVPAASPISAGQGIGALPGEGTALQVQRLQRTVGNQAVMQMMKSGVIQMKPVLDTKHPGFYKDDKIPKLKLKEKKTGTAGELKTAEFEIRNQMKTIYWKEDKPDSYFEDEGLTQPFDASKFAQSSQFGAWLETYQESVKAQAEIEDMSISTEEKQRLKDAISNYLLQKFISNALFRSEEIARMDYQASPLNFQTNSQYMRSFATSFTAALQRTLPSFPDGRLVLSRTDKLDNVLSQFFQVMKVTNDSEINTDQLKTSLAKTVEKSADYLLTNDKDLTEYWTVPGNPQAFVDVTPLLKNVSEKNMAGEAEKLGKLVRQAYIKALTQKMVEMEGAKKVKEEDQRGLVVDEATRKLNEHVELKKFDETVDRLSNKKNPERPTQIANDPFVEQQIEPFMVWLKKKVEQDESFVLTTVEKNLLKAKTDQLKQKFIHTMKEDHFKQYLTETKASMAIKEEDFTHSEAWDIFSGLKEKIDRAYTSSNMVVTTGGVITLKDSTNAYEQAAILTDDKAMGMAVKTAINKSGNVPSPTESTRKLFKTKELKEIVVSVMDSQKQKAPNEDHTVLSDLKKSITGFKPEDYTSLAQAVNQLELTKHAFDDFKAKFKEDTTNIGVEAKAAIKLIEGSGVLEEGGKLPNFVLKQLQQLIEDATASQAVIEDYVRNIQGMHEACIFALEWRGAAPDPDYDYGAPKLGGTDEYFRGTHLTDYGLKAFSQAYDAVVAQVQAGGSDGINIEAFYNIYFELNDKLRATQNTSKDNKVSLQSPSSIDDYLGTVRFNEINVKAGGPDVILIDIHPNDATKAKIARNEVSNLISSVFEKKKLHVDYDKFRCTVIVDITMNHTTEDEVREIRVNAQPYIESGNLNLVFVQSLTKFAQLGMDKQSGGLIFSYNKADAWSAFNDKLAELRNGDPVDKGIQNYFQALFKYTTEEQVEYVQRVRANTKELRSKLEAAFGKLKEKGAIELSENTDEGTCYVSLRYDEFLGQLSTQGVKQLDDEHKFNVDVLELGINKILSQTGLPVAMRFSFGFPVSNLGEVGNEVRFTIGLEGSEKLEEYAKILTYISGKLNEKFKNGGSDDLKVESSRQAFLKEIAKDINSMDKLEKALEPLLKP